jgi:class 3 adenylate cyclase
LKRARRGHDLDMRVRRTFAFVDLCGFTQLTDSQGDDDAVAVLATFRFALREVCSRRGVRIAKWLGDGAMLVCVEVAPAVATVLEMERRVVDENWALALRAGMTTGDVIMFEGDDYIGHPVNLASRLCAAAGPGEVLAQPEVAAAAPDWVSVQPVPDRELRGVAQPVPLVELDLCGEPDVEAVAEPPEPT